MNRKPIEGVAVLAVTAFVILAGVLTGPCAAEEFQVGDLQIALDGSGNITVSSKGTEIFRDSFIVATREWKGLYPTATARPAIQVDLSADTVFISARDDRAGVIRLRKSISVMRGEVAIEMDYTVDGQAGANVADYNLKVPESLLSGAPYEVWTALYSREGSIQPTGEAKEVTLESSVERMLISTKAGRLSFDLSAVSSTAPKDSLRRRDGNGWNLNDIHNMPWGKGLFWFSLKQYAERVGKEIECSLRVSFRLQSAAQPAPTFTTLDLRSAVNTGFRDETEGDRQGGWTDQGANDMRNLPVGRQTCAGVPFDIIDPATNGGRSCIVAKGKTRPYLPASFKIPVGRAARTLYFLQTCAFTKPGNPVIAHYKVRFRCGREVDVPIRAGIETCDWWSAQDTGLSAVGWKGANAVRNPVGLNVFAWSNPYPEEIEEIVLTSAESDATPILVAVTASDVPPDLPRAKKPVARTDTSSWFPFSLAWDDTATGWIDVSFLLDPPAGKHGFMVAKDGHLHFEDGARGRFWGTNMTGNACYPTHEQAEKIARRIAKFGCNIIRVHIHDTSQTMEDETGKFEGIFDVSEGNTKAIAPSRLDRLDYLLSQCKKNGIYIIMDLLSYRHFKAGDGVKDADQFYHVGGAAIATMFDQRLIELQKNYATDILTHVNPYTGKKYIEEPALVLIELTNENGLFQLGAWASHALPPSYRSDLTARWNRWLLSRYGDRQKLSATWTNADGQSGLGANEDPAAGTVELPATVVYPGAPDRDYRGNLGTARTNDCAQFYLELETNYYKTMRDHLRSLGLKVPICGTNTPLSPAHLRSEDALDFTDQHYYWDHPSGFNPVTIQNRPLVEANLLDPKSGRRHFVSHLASAKIAGKPFFCTEWGFPYPSDYRAEGPATVAAYACLQDWDGITATHYNSQAVLKEEGALRGSFQIYNDPLTFGQFPAAALMFHRHDVEAARRLIQVGSSRVDSFYCQNWDGLPFRFFPFISRTENRLFEDRYEGQADLVVSSGLSPTGDYSAAPRRIVFSNNPWSDLYNKTKGKLEAFNPQSLFERFQADAKEWGIEEWKQPEGALRSDNGHVLLDYQRGILSLHTPRTQGALGFLGRGKVELEDVTIESRTEFCSILVSSLDDKPISASQKCLVTAVGRAENTGQVWNFDRTKVIDRGKAPILVEPVAATIVLKRQGVKLQALDATGAVAADIPAQGVDGGVALAIGPEHRTIFYGVSAGQ